MLPELQSKDIQKKNILEKELSSFDNVLDLEETTNLLKKNKLMVENIDQFESKDLLR